MKLGIKVTTPNLEQANEIVQVLTNAEFIDAIKFISTLSEAAGELTQYVNAFGEIAEHPTWSAERKVEEAQELISDYTSAIARSMLNVGGRTTKDVRKAFLRFGQDPDEFLSKGGDLKVLMKEIIDKTPELKELKDLIGDGATELETIKFIEDTLKAKAPEMGEFMGVSGYEYLDIDWLPTDKFAEVLEAMDGEYRALVGSSNAGDRRGQFLASPSAIVKAMAVIEAEKVD